MITRDFYYVAPHSHVVHFRNECAKYLHSFNTMKQNGRGVVFLFAQPKGKTLCDHCQAIEKRAKRAVKRAAK